MSAPARIRKTALQHEQERQYDKALALYARLLDGAEAGEEEIDVALFNRAGDLALRLGDTPRALGYFERALDLYAAAGMLNNAVALGVKILRHAPTHLSAHYTLGVLYGRKGFAGDARHHLLTYAVQMHRAGRADEASRVLGEVAAACLDAGERRAALDAYGALGGDPAQAVALAPAPVTWGAVDFEPVALGPAASVVPSTTGDVPPATWDALDLEPPAVFDCAPAGTPGAPPAEGDAPHAGSSLVFLDTAGNPEALAGLLDLEPPMSEAHEPPTAVTAGPAAPHVGASAAPRGWAHALPDEPPPLRLAELLRLDPVPTVGALQDVQDVIAAPAVALPAVAVAIAESIASPPSDAAEPLDLGAWLRETTSAPTTRFTTASVPQTGDEQADFDATLRAFTAGVSRAVGHEDFDSHYDLGVAFREMGLLDEAIVEFQRAALAPGRPLRALEALAQCFVDARQPEVALSTLEAPAAGAAAAGVGDASLVAVHYLMGVAAQALGRPDDARRWFVRVVATDVRFRDAATRLAALPPPSPVR